MNKLRFESECILPNRFIYSAGKMTWFNAAWVRNIMMEWEPTFLIPFCKS